MLTLILIYSRGIAHAEAAAAEEALGSPVMSTAASFFTSEPGKTILNTVLTFLLTTVAGGILTVFWSRLSWKREKNFERLSRRLDRQRELVEELSQLMGERVFRLERVLWAVEDIKSEADLTDESTERISSRWNEYYETVVRYSAGLRRYRVRIGQLSTNELADTFCLDEAESRSPTTRTLHGQFVQTHNIVKKLRDCALKRKPITEPEQMEEVRRKLDDLYDSMDDFLQRLQASFHERIAIEWRTEW